MRKAVLLLVMATFWVGQQQLSACEAAFYCTTIPCGCGGNMAIYQCSYVSYNSTCKSCYGCGYICCQNFVCSACNTGSSCYVSPSASLREDGLGPAGSPSTGCGGVPDAGPSKVKTGHGPNKRKAPAEKVAKAVGA